MATSLLNLQLEDILASYPSQEEPGLQSIITRKQEFAELRAEGREPRPRPGEYMLHQQFVSRFMRAFDTLFAFWATGSGKTCGVVAAAEWFKEQRKLGGNIKKVLYLVPGPTLKEEVARQIACSCTKRGEYTAAPGARTRSGKPARSSIRVGAKIRKWYKITAYRSFVQKFILSKINSIKPPKDPSNQEEMDRWRSLIATKRREIYEEFSDTLIILDEPQTINTITSRAEMPEEERFRLRQERRERREIRTRTALASEILEYEDPNLVEQKEEKERKERRGTSSSRFMYIDHEDVYDELWLLLHNVVRSKVIIATATPMTGDVEEIRTLMNLILPRDKQIPLTLDLRALVTNKDKEIGLKVMRPYFEGRISYVRSLETGVHPTYMENRGKGSKLLLNMCGPGIGRETAEEAQNREDTNLAIQAMNEQLDGRPYPETSSGAAYPDSFIPLAKIYRTIMSEYQNDCYHQATKRSKYSEREVVMAGDEKAQGLQVDARHASNFVFPPNAEGKGLWGSSGFQRWVDNRGDTFSGKTAKTLRENKFLDENGVESVETEVISLDFGQEISDIENIRYYSCKYAAIVEICASNPGSDFIYGEFKVGSGLIVLALCFEAMGFEPFQETESVFLASSGGEDDFCGGTKGRGSRTINPRFPKKCRYALLTPETSKYHDSMRELFNSYENRHGEYIKAIMVSPTAQIGLSFNNILRGHLIGSEWTESANYQALSRFIRATSHEDLIKELESQGIIQPVIEVQIYQHCAVPWRYADPKDPTAGIIFERGIDEEMYYASERKDRWIKSMERWMKQCAVDCVINKAKNQRPEDKGKDGSQQCDYQSCNYKCIDEPIPKGLDVSTYDVYYTDQVVDLVVSEYQKISFKLTYFTIEDMYARFPDIRSKFIDIALERMVYNKMDFLDDFGYHCYLVEDNGNFTLTRSFPTESSHPNYYSSYYPNNLIALTGIPMVDIAFELQREEQQELSANLLQDLSQGQDVAKEIAELGIEYQVKILEDAVTKSLTAPDAQTKAVLDLYQPYYFSFREPVTEMNKDLRASLGPKTGRPKGSGKKGKSRKEPKVKLDQVVMDKTGEIVHAHFLYGKSASDLAYGAMARYDKAEGQIRILKPSEGKGWRDCLPSECPAYNRVIRKEIAARKGAVLDRPYYGKLEQDGIFRIVNRTTESIDAQEDDRKKNTGLQCESNRVSVLLSILYDLGYRATIPPNPSHELGLIIKGKKDASYSRERVLNRYIEQQRNRPFEEVIEYVTSMAGSPPIEEVRRWPKEKVIYVAAFTAANVNKSFDKKKAICPLLQILFEERGEIVRT